MGTMQGGIQARFDDLSPGGRGSFRLVEPVGVVEAFRPGEVLDALRAAEAATVRGLWVAGFVAYEAAPGLDPALAVRRRSADDPFAGLPLVWFGMFSERVDDAPPELDAGSPSPGDAWRPSIPRERYDLAIARIRERIAAGDTYQVNYTLRLRATIAGDEEDFYRDLCLSQRGAHAAYLNAGRYRILSASPELFFLLEGDRLVTRPMKGTIGRGRWAAEDEANAQALRDSTKDRAENAMIVDLLRNDMGRISVHGSVRPVSLFDTERYETVWQMTSTIESRLPAGSGVVDVFRALFPSGSVTGAPKVSTMRIIAGLEGSPRGVYCGAVGWMAPAGAGPRSAFNVAIRTVMLDAQTGLAEYGVGGGITWDSTPGGEFDEARTKALVLTARRPPFELLESLRLDPDEGSAFLEEHLERLEDSARYFGYRFDRELTLGALEKVAADAPGGTPLKVRLLLARDGTLTATAEPIAPSPGEPVRLALDDEPVDPADVFLFHKTTRRQPYERRSARHPDAEDVLLVNTRGQITESAVANVAVKLAGRWWTPPLSCGLLPGTYRARLLADGTLAERAITVEEARNAEGLALVNSVRLWRDAVLIG